MYKKMPNKSYIRYYRQFNAIGFDKKTPPPTKAGGVFFIILLVI